MYSKVLFKKEKLHKGRLLSKSHICVYLFHFQYFPILLTEDLLITTIYLNLKENKGTGNIPAASFSDDVSSTQTILGIWKIR